MSYILLQQQSLQVLQHCATAHNFEPKTQHTTLHVLQHRQTDRQTDRQTSRHTDRHTLIYSRLFFPHRSDRCCINREFNKCVATAHIYIYNVGAIAKRRPIDTHACRCETNHLEFDSSCGAACYSMLIRVLRLGTTHHRPLQKMFRWGSNRTCPVPASR